MQNRLMTLFVLLSLGVVVQTAPAAKESMEKSGDKNAVADKGKEKKDDAVRREALRRKVTKNVELLAAQLDLNSSQLAKVKALISQQQWDAAVSTFTTARENEIHKYAHDIARKTIPGMMQKFMPAYMQGKISAQRRKQGRRGPPSGSEIAKIRKDAQSKMQPTMRETVMPALDELTKARLAEMLQDEKVLTRMLADRIIKANVLDEGGTKHFASVLEKAGFPASLTTGDDTMLNDRTKKMLNSIDLKQVAEAAGL